MDYRGDLFWVTDLGATMAWVLLLSFGLVVVVQLVYYWFFFARLAFGGRRSPVGVASMKPVSVVICARNEFVNLRNNLPLVLQQDYPDFEVVVVDDGSQDDSEQLLKQFQKEYAHLKVIILKDSVSFLKGKKLPLSVGIKSAANDTLLLTDADCRPAGNQWIREMTSQLGGGTDVVLGYGAYEQRPGLLNMLIRLDTLTVAMQYLGLARAGIPYMGVGRNLAYSRSLFYKAKGFTSHYRVPSGDDDLFINQVATRSNTLTMLSPGSFTVSRPETTWKKWFRQKKRHLSTGKYYKKRDQYLLGLFLVSQWLFYPLFVGSILVLGYSLMGLIAGSLFLIRMVSYLVVVKGASKRLQESKICLFSLVGDGMLTFMQMLFSLSLLFVRKTKWK